MRHVRNRPCFVLWRLFQAFGLIYFTISKFLQKHEYLQYKKNLKQNQTSCSINPPPPYPVSRNESQQSPILRPIIIIKKHKPATERRNNWICREQRVQSFEKRRIIGLFVREERCHPPWPGSIKTITTQSGGSNPI